MKQKLTAINKELLPLGLALKAVSPLGDEVMQRALGPVSAEVLGVLKWIHPSSKTVYIKRSDGSKLRLLVMRGKQRAGKTIGILWLHGGGYVLGAPEMAYVSFPRHLLEHYNCVIVAPAYTLSYELPYPAALEDAYLALRWMHRHPKTLGIDCKKLVVGGESSGGGLAAALCLYARDKGFRNIGMQLPLYPMLDDRETETNAYNYAPVWDSSANRAAWRIYLGRTYGIAPVSEYAAPARALDVSGLPPALSIIGTTEPFYAETCRYFERLRSAGVACTLAEFEGAYHAFDMLAPFTTIGKQATAFLLDAFESYIQQYIIGDCDNFKC